MNWMMLTAYEQQLKWCALALGLASTVSIVQGWQQSGLLFSLLFCLIWIYCAWLRREPQLKYINVIFVILYVYGIARYIILEA